MIQPSPKNHSHVEDNPQDKRLLEQNDLAVQSLSILLFLSLSSILFTGLFEWDRYQVIAGTAVQSMSTLDKVLLFWLLTAKSVAWFMPFLIIWGIFIGPGRWRTTAIILNILCIVMFYLMAFDLVSVSFAGYHVWDYLPNVQDMLKNPDMKIWQWAGERLTTEAMILLAIFVIFSPLCFFSAKWITIRLVSRFRWLVLQPLPAMVTSFFTVFVLSSVPILDSFPDRIYTALPLPPIVKESLERVTGVFGARLGLTHTPTINASFLPLGYAAATPLQLLPPTSRNMDQVGNPFEHNSDAKQIGLGSDELGRNRHPDQGLLVNAQDELAVTKLLREASDPGPVDVSAFVNKQGLPNVILIIFESFRHSAISPGLMKELDAWSEQGLRLQRHYSGSNCSHLGLFSLLYGRTPLGYHQTLDHNIQAQMLESLRRSGYEITFLTSGETKGFRRLDRFINDKSCDNYISEGEFSLKGMKDWPDSDRRKLAHAQGIVNRSQDRPQFVFFYLVSSHYRYSFPPEFDINKETSSIWEFLNPRAQIQNHLNRYANAALFLEHEVLKLVSSLDPKKTLIIITGDHGESMGEDGVFTHGSRMSEIQMRVPFIMVGPGVEPRKISTATVHSDILPTLLHALGGTSVPVLHSHGRDLIADLEPADEVVVAPANGLAPDRLMIIRGDRRLIFRPATITGKSSVMEFEGLADTSGHYELKISRIRRVSGANR